MIVGSVARARREQAALILRNAATMQTVADNRGGWHPFIREPFSGAWQRNIEWSTDTVLAHSAVYTCVTLIANDIGKLRPKLVEYDEAAGIWTEVTRESPYRQVLKRPNRYQNHIQFKEAWAISRLTRGNTYALKERDGRRIVRALYLLDPQRVQVLVAPDGSVFYRLHADNLSNVEEAVTVPAREIIHDRMNCLFHPLVGVSPIFASGMAASVGLRIEKNAAAFFENGSNPSGTLTAPGTIPQATADRLADQWNRNYSGENSGRVAVLGDSLKWEPMRMSAVDSQMIEHLKWSAETVCNTFHVPHFKAGVGTQPTYQNGEVLNQIYYSDCLQAHIESFEVCMDEGLGLDEKVEGRQYGVELDLDDLLRMDQGAQAEFLVKASGGAFMTPDEARRKGSAGPPLPGGDTLYRQQQDFSIAALAERDQNKPFSKPDTPTEPAGPDDDDDDDVARAFELRARAHKQKAAAA